MSCNIQNLNITVIVLSTVTYTEKLIIITTTAFPQSAEYGENITKIFTFRHI